MLASAPYNTTTANTATTTNATQPPLSPCVGNHLVRCLLLLIQLLLQRLGILGVTLLALEGLPCKLLLALHKCELGTLLPVNLLLLKLAVFVLNLAGKRGAVNTPNAPLAGTPALRPAGATHIVAQLKPD